MKQERTFAALMRSLLYRPAQLAVVVVVVLFLLALAVLGVLSWRDLQRLDTIRAQIDQTRAVQQTTLALQSILLDEMAGRTSVDQTKLREARKEISTLVASGGRLGTDISRKLGEALDTLANPDDQPRTVLASALGTTSQALDAQARSQSELLDALSRDSRIELRLALGALIGFPMLLGLAVWLLRQRIFGPINDLKELLSRIADGKFTPVEIQQGDTLVAPVLENYNRMVRRLEELELAHHRHAQNLRSEVRAATKALLKQQQDLAQAERLAAVGELAASVAHELRNPLAGVQMTLANLRLDLANPELVERLDLVLAEVQRISRLLNDLLAPARHSPEPARDVDLAAMVKELLTLMRYQTAQEIGLEARVPEHLLCHVPEDRLRQALLNVVLNSVQAMNGCGGNIVVMGEEQQGCIRLAVCDDGPGFSAALLATGVRPFITGREQGVGLGLAVVNRFIQDMGGELTIANRTPRGACVMLSLPMEKSHG
jgi:C4-dicarboxylate-specific signal transduction histidine kinase